MNLHQLVTFKVYADVDGAFTAVPSHVPVGPSKVGPASKPPLKAGRGQAPSRPDKSSPSPEGAIEEAVLALHVLADRLAAKEWGRTRSTEALLNEKIMTSQHPLEWSEGSGGYKTLGKQNAQDVSKSSGGLV